MPLGRNPKAWHPEVGVRAIWFLLAALLLCASCSDDKPIAPKSSGDPEQVLKRDCNDAQWREQNLGLWYSVCRQPLRW
jgi:hypothetical protein